MKFAATNLSWNNLENDSIAEILHEFEVKGIEVAMSKIWTDPAQVKKQELKKYRKYWNSKDIEIVATTSLLFGHPEFTIFSGSESRKQTLKYLKKIICASSILGAKAMVFGSPKNRKTNGESIETVNNIAIDFFSEIAEYAQKYNIYFGIEANPLVYGTDFINTTSQAINLVRQVSHPNFSLHLDTGTMTINGEDYKETINQSLPFAHHLHISEPGLKIIPTEKTNHKDLAIALINSGYRGWISLEMPLGDDTDHPKTIRKTLNFIKTIYQ